MKVRRHKGGKLHLGATSPRDRRRIRAEAPPGRCGQPLKDREDGGVMGSYDGDTHAGRCRTVGRRASDLAGYHVARGHGCRDHGAWDLRPRASGERVKREGVERGEPDTRAAMVAWIAGDRDQWVAIQAHVSTVAGCAEIEQNMPWRGRTSGSTALDADMVRAGNLGRLRGRATGQRRFACALGVARHDQRRITGLACYGHWRSFRRAGEA